MNTKLSIGIALICGIFWTLPIRGLAENKGRVISVVEENDLIANTDQHYTQGFKFTHLFEDDYIPRRVDRASERLTEYGIDVEARKFGYVLGQNIYTPADIRPRTLQKNDRPYAGWLYAGIILQRRGTAGDHARVLENFEFQAGVIGSESMAEDIQTEVHRISGATTPRGWDHQLKTEPGLAFRYTRMWLFRAGDFVSADFIPRFGLSLGNVGTYANLGGTLRFGINVPQDFGVNTIDAPSSVSVVNQPHWGFYLFTGTDVRFVAYNVFVDGNLFRNSHSVDKRHVVADFKFGAALVMKWFELSYTGVVRTPEFHEQSNSDAFGSVALKFTF